MKNQPQFVGGPLDPRVKPRRFIQVFASNGVNTHGKPDQLNRTISQGTYTLKEETENGPVYEWRGVR